MNQIEFVNFLLENDLFEICSYELESLEDVKERILKRKQSSSEDVDKIIEREFSEQTYQKEFERIQNILETLPIFTSKFVVINKGISTFCDENYKTLKEVKTYDKFGGYSKEHLKLCEKFQIPENLFCNLGKTPKQFKYHNCIKALIAKKTKSPIFSRATIEEILKKALGK